MATVALPRPIPAHRGSSTAGAITSPITPPRSLEDTDGSHGPSSSGSSHQHVTPAPVPNKHIPVCPTGPAKAADPDTPPPSPKQPLRAHQTSFLHPPDRFSRIDSEGLFIYEIGADHVAQAVEHAASQPLPHPSLVFPWLHGLHPANQLQLTFFNIRGRSSKRTPSCLRGVTLVKADGDVNFARLKGAIAPEEFMHNEQAEFADADPRDGFSVRNFQIQPAKVALTSDIVVYGDDVFEARRIAWEVAHAQHRWLERCTMEGFSLPKYNTFICTSPFEQFERNHGNIVSIDSRGCHTGTVVDFVHQERREMWDMTEASEISHNVFLGPTPEPGSLEERKFDVLIDCSDAGRLDPDALRATAQRVGTKVEQRYHEFPSSGSILPPTWSHDEADCILNTCKWIYHISHGILPASSAGNAVDADLDGDTSMLLEGDESRSTCSPRKVLIHCADGYTESTMLGIAYYSYSTGRSVPDAWLSLHTEKRRNFFAYPTDVALLTGIAPRLLHESPACSGRSLEDITKMVTDEPKWLAGLDGSLPSRILDYLYLGNLGHANNPDLLRDMGIGQILSVGEMAIWREGDLEAWGEENVCLVQGVQDNGIDPLTDEFVRCLEFIGK